MNKALYNTAAPYAASHIVFIRENKVALLLRHNTKWMDGYYALPAGKIEKGESATSAAVREAIEEVGVTIDEVNLREILTVYRQSEDSLWVDFVFTATTWEGELINAEPNIHAEVTWFDLNNLPDNIIPSVKFYIEQIVSQNSFAEYGWS